VKAGESIALGVAASDALTFLVVVVGAKSPGAFRFSGL
jgi:hypothetical protein